MYLKQDFPWPCHFTSVPFAASKSHRWWPAVAKIGSLGLSVPHSNLWYRKAFCQFKLPQFGGKSQRLDKACWRASIEHGCSVIMLDCTCPFSPKCSMFSTWFCPNTGGYQNLWRWRKGPSEPWDCWGYEQFVLVMCLFRACSIHIFLILPSLLVGFKNLFSSLFYLPLNEICWWNLPQICRHAQASPGFTPRSARLACASSSSSLRRRFLTKGPWKLVEWRLFSGNDLPTIGCNPV